MTFKCHSTTWIVALLTWKKSHFRLDKDRKWHQFAIRQLQTSLFRLHPNRILEWSRGRKWVRSALQPLQKSLFEFTIVAFSAVPEAENKLQFLYRQKKFAFSVGQEANNDFKVAFENLNLRFFVFIVIVFWLVKRQKMNSQGLATTTKVSLLASPKSHFRLQQSRRIALKSHLLPLDKPKIRLW